MIKLSDFFPTELATPSAAEKGNTGSPRTARQRLRNRPGLTQDDLAKKADIKYTTLMKVEGKN